MSLRRTPILFATVAGLGLAGTLTACGPKPITADPTLSSPAATAPATTATPTAPRVGTTNVSVVPSTPTTAVPNYTPISERTTDERGLDFGVLTKIINKNGVVTLSLDRAIFLTGDAAKQHNGGKTPEDDYLIENANPKVRTFVLDPKASLQAENALRNHPDLPGRETLTRAQFLHNAATTVGTSPVYVWVRHTDGLNGPITALAEQYLP